MQMPALDADEPDEKTREYPEEEREHTLVVPPGEIENARPAASTPGVDGRRVRIVFAALVLLVIAAGLLIWGLSR
jgi:hypothetical protein